MFDLPVWLLTLAIPVGALAGVVITVLFTRKNAREANLSAAAKTLQRRSEARGKASDPWTVRLAGAKIVPAEGDSETNGSSAAG